jgi:hypothetical protein
MWQSACFIDNIDDAKVNDILDELKSLGENVDNIYSVDSTVDKICCMLIESAKSLNITSESKRQRRVCTSEKSLPGSNIEKELVIFSKLGDTMYSSRPH